MHRPNLVDLVRSCLLATLIFAATGNATEKRITFDEVGLSIDQPAGFVRAERFNGLENKDTGASIVLVVLPGPYDKVTAGLTKQGLSQRGMLLHSRETASIAGRNSLLLDVEQSAHGRTFRKWIAAFGDERTTSLITANYPAELIVELRASLKRAVQSVQTSSASGDPSAANPLFTLGKVATLKPVPAISAMGKMRAYTRSGKFPIAHPGEAFFLAAPSLGAPKISDHEQAATSRVKSLAGTEINKFETLNKISIDALPGIEILALGTNTKTGAHTSVYQVMLFPEDGGYFLLTGQVASKNSDLQASLDAFRALARTFKQTTK